MTTHSKSNRSAFYRNPALWLIIGVPITAVVVVLSMVAVSINNYDGVVADDYYKQGKLINNTIERDVRAQKLGIRADLHVDETAVTLTFDPSLDISLPNTIDVSFVHRTRSGFDRTISLYSTNASTYTLPLDEPLSATRWIVIVAADDWRVNGTLNWPTQSVSELIANPNQ